MIAVRWSVAAPNSSEFGDGLARSEFNPEIFGDDLCEAMRDVKRLFDPDQRINPARVADAPRMTENLRDANLPPVPLLRTRLDFEVLGGITGAADRCMNIGLCARARPGDVPVLHRHPRRGTRDSKARERTGESAPSQTRKRLGRAHSGIATGRPPDRMKIKSSG